MAEWKGRCQFCEEERSGNFIPPDQVSLKHGLPISYSGGQLCRCVQCGSLYCGSCATNHHGRCPKCGDDKWQHAVYGIVRGGVFRKGVYLIVLALVIVAVIVWWALG
jgi:hypothetical protein